MDLGLPDMDGTELIREIRSYSVTPILVLSARIQETDKVEALDLGANDYITKPFGTAELLAGSEPPCVLSVPSAVAARKAAGKARIWKSATISEEFSSMGRKFI